MPKFHDELREASLENVAGNPTLLPTGKIWLDTSVGLPKFHNGTAVSTFVDLDTAQTLSNKAIVTPSRSDVKTDTEANLTTYASTAAAGQMAYASDTKEFYGIYDSVLNSIGGGGGSGKKNYCPNGDFKTGIDGATSDDASIVVSYETAAPLRAPGCLKIVATTAVVDKKVTVVLDTFDVTDKHSLIENGFDYTYDGPEDTVVVGLYDNTNSVLITGSLSYLKAGTFTYHTSIVQTSPDSVDYDLVIVDKVGGSSYTILVDEISSSPDVQQVGSGEDSTRSAVIGQGVTPSIDIHNGNWIDSIVRNGISDYTINFKSNSFQGTPVINVNWRRALNTNTRYSCSAWISAASSTSCRVIVAYMDDAGGNQVGTDESGEIHITAHEPAGAGSSLSGGDILAKCKATKSATQSIDSVAYTDVFFENTVDDNLGWVDTDGSTYWKFVVGRSCDLSVKVSTLIANSTAWSLGNISILEIRLNDVLQYRNLYEHTGNTVGTFSIPNQVDGDLNNLVKGDVIHTRIYQDSGSTLNLISNAHYCNININEKAQTSNGVAPEQTQVYCKYTSINAQQLDTNFYFLYEDKVEDSHNAYDPVSGRFTAPESGIYEVHYRRGYASFTPVAGNFIGSKARINGNSINNSEYAHVTTLETALTDLRFVAGYYKARLNKGDYIRIIGQEDVGAALLSHTDASTNWLTVQKVGI